MGSEWALLDQAVTRQFNELPKPESGKIMAEYVWIGGTGWDLRSKTRTLPGLPKSIDELPLWNYDGSSTGQAPGDDSEVFLKPCAMFKDPFRGGDNIMVMCDIWIPPTCQEDGSVTPMKVHPQNTRDKCAKQMAQCAAEKPWFGIEQEYTLLNSDTKWPLGWPKLGYPGPQGPYYCSAGTGNAIGRDVVEAHYKACLHAGINISGVNAEVMPGQWEYQVGPCLGIEMGDHLWMSRYLLFRVTEMFNVIVSFDPKPVPGDWNGAGCHCNYSTEGTRNEGGWAVMQEHFAKLGPKHMEHMEAYGEGNERRMTGQHETASFTQFGWGVANRGASIRVPRLVPVEGKGYYEDRRPASNIDPYIVTGKIVQTTLLD